MAELHRYFLLAAMAEGILGVNTDTGKAKLVTIFHILHKPNFNLVQAIAIELATTNDTEIVSYLSYHPSHPFGPTTACEPDYSLSGVAIMVSVELEIEDTFFSSILSFYTGSVSEGWRPKPTIQLAS